MSHPDTSPDHTVIIDDDTARDDRDKYLGAIERNLRVVAQNPGKKVRIVSYPKRNSADSLASDLRNHKRGTRRPDGDWTFTSGPTVDGRWGVWAIYTPPPEQ